MKKLTVIMFLFLMANNILAQNAYKISTSENPITSTKYYTIENPIKTNQQGMTIGVTYYYDHNYMENMSFEVSQKSRIFTRPITQKIYKEGGEYDMSIVHKPATFIFEDGTSLTTTCRFTALYDFDNERLITDYFSFDLDEDENDRSRSAIFTRMSKTNIVGIQFFGVKFNFVDFKSAVAFTELRNVSGKNRKITINANGHEYVDLGLPSGTLWATCNVGAYKPSDYGYYIAWGETNTKSFYSYSNLKYCIANNDNLYFTKYTTNRDNAAGSIDGKSELDLTDDVAHVKWSGDWRTPSIEQLKELKENCTWTWTYLNGQIGCKVVGNNGNYIFLPAGGYKHGNETLDKNSEGIYWSRTLYENLNSGAHYLYFTSKGAYLSSFSRYNGRNIRPVIEFNNAK